ncbi:MAG TPA: HlyD family efflux transporter periplasmic adaptor subunit [Pseudobacteroides sp.]|uniref:HlyD family efflux transporter periplasmic adaptor subunit n=1 Tax=Pseudobacteroides sp. TaxID=1968840 RepID=UPI002F92B1E5
MKTYIQDIKDMSDSREMLEAKPHFFMAWFVYILFAIIGAALIWAYFGEIDDYVKANGAVRPGERISTIRNAIAGRVEKVNIEEGMRVKKGDVLYTIEANGILLDKDEKVKLVSRLEKENKNLQKFKKSVLEEKNFFDPVNADEVDYYNQFQKYMTDRKTNVEQLNNSKLDLMQLKGDAKSSMKMVEVKLKNTKDVLKNLETMLVSVEKNKNLFDKGNTEYQRRYEDYEFNINRLNSLYEQKRDTYERIKKLYDAGGVARKELEDAKNQMELAKLDADKFKNEFVMNLQDSIKQSEESVGELTNSISKWKTSLDAYNGKSQNTELVIEKLHLDTLGQIEDGLSANRMNLDKAKSELKNLELNLKEAIVTSPIDGIVNLYTEINRGDLIQNGIDIAAIVPYTSTQYKIQLMVSNKDIASIKEGQRIKYHFLALPYREYGEVEGIVKRIGTDARVDKESGSNFYMVEATVDKTELESYKGVKAQVKVGMVCEARVVTKSRKILWWLLEKINLID